VETLGSGRRSVAERIEGKHHVSLDVFERAMNGGLLTATTAIFLVGLDIP